MNRAAGFLKLCLRRFDNFWLYVCGGAFASLFTVASCFGHLSWRFDLLANFLPQYALVLLVCVAGLLLSRRWLPALCLAPFLALCLAFIIPLYLPAKAAPQFGKDAPHYKLLSFNVLSSNRGVDGILSFIESENPDFIVMTEYTKIWADAVKRLSPRYKLQLIDPDKGNFGIAILGRFEGMPRLAYTDDEFSLPAHCVDFSLPGGRSLRLVGAHATLPASQRLCDVRSKFLMRCAKLCRESGMPSVLAGDFNMAPFSPFYGEILKEGGLVSASKGRGLCLTWPTWRYLPIKPMSMQIDHCLVSKEVEVISWRRGPDLGSDHYPVLVEFALD